MIGKIRWNDVNSNVFLVNFKIDEGLVKQRSINCRWFINESFKSIFPGQVQAVFISLHVNVKVSNHNCCTNSDGIVEYKSLDLRVYGPQNFFLIFNLQVLLSKKPLRSSHKFFRKNFSQVFKGPSNSREQNQLYIQNQNY